MTKLDLECSYFKNAVDRQHRFSASAVRSARKLFPPGTPVVVRANELWRFSALIFSDFFFDYRSGELRVYVVTSAYHGSENWIRSVRASAIQHTADRHVTDATRRHWLRNRPALRGPRGRLP